MSFRTRRGIWNQNFLISFDVYRGSGSFEVEFTPAAAGAVAGLATVLPAERGVGSVVRHIYEFGIPNLEQVTLTSVDGTAFRVDNIVFEPFFL
jgi:hypothetical protein